MRRVRRTVIYTGQDHWMAHTLSKSLLLGLTKPGPNCSIEITEEEMMSPIEIARVCHEVNAAYCRSLGDTSHLPWDQTPVDIQESAIRGVIFRLDNPTTTPEEQHDAWAAAKQADGWIYGEVKDPVAKTHPCLVPYGELPHAQRAKDYIFQGVVDALKDR